MKTLFFAVNAILIASLASAGMASAAAQNPAGTSAVDTPPPTITVFVEATLGFRESGMARKLSDQHASQAARGYRFVDMAAYTENGDLQGFFVTYTRD